MSKNASTSSHKKAPDSQTTKGELYRVRDKNDLPKKQYGTVWDINLTHKQALSLKDDVVAKRKSSNARLELMSVANPGDPEGGNRDGSWKAPATVVDDDDIVDVQKTVPHEIDERPPLPLAAATEAASGAAKSAQERHDALKARQAELAQIKDKADAQRAELDKLAKTMDKVVEGDDFSPSDVDSLFDGDEAPVLEPGEKKPIPLDSGSLVLYFDKDLHATDVHMALVLSGVDDSRTIQLGVKKSALVFTNGVPTSLGEAPNGLVLPNVPKWDGQGERHRTWSPVA